MVQISIEIMLSLLAIIVIPILVYFVKLEMRVRKLEGLEELMNLKSKLENLESLRNHPLFLALTEINLEDAMNVYRNAREKKNE